MNSCTNCGNTLEEDAKFCSNCGAKTSSSTVTRDEARIANVKVEVTNATAEKAFKKVGEAIDSGKKTTTVFIKKVLFPIFIIGAFVIIIAFAIEYQHEQERAQERKKAYQEKVAIFESYVKQLPFGKDAENRDCVKEQIELYYLGGFGYSLNSRWEHIRTQCNLSYDDYHLYKKNAKRYF